MGAVWGACASPDQVVIATPSVASAVTSAVIWFQDTVQPGLL